MSTIYLGTIDAGGDGQVLLMAAVNAAGNTNYSLDDWEFGEPEIVTVSGTTHNTKISLGPKAGTGYYGVKRIFYNRIHASELGQIIVPYANELYVSAILTKINEKYGILIKTTDIYDALIPAPSSGQSQVMVTLQFRPESIIFYDGVQIQIGQNDPTGDTSPELPTENYQTFFSATQPTENSATGLNDLLFTSLTIDRDRVRKISSVVEDNLAKTNGVLSSIEAQLSNFNYNAESAELPFGFVGSYRDPITTKIYLVSTSGDIYESNNNVNLWTNIGNALGLTSADMGYFVEKNGYDFKEAENNWWKYAVKSVTQDRNGVVWVLARGPNGRAGVYNNSTSHALWTRISTNTPRLVSLGVLDSTEASNQAWRNFSISDSYVINNKLHLMVLGNWDGHFPKTTDYWYDVHPSKGRFLPSVEIVDLGTGTGDYFPLAEAAGAALDRALIEQDSDDFRRKSHWRFVDPPHEQLGINYLNVVCLIHGWQNDFTLDVPVPSFVLYFHKDTSGEYIPSVLPIDPNKAPAIWNKNESSISAYQITLDQVPAQIGGSPSVGHVLEVIEVSSRVKVNRYNNNFVEDDLRHKDGYYSKGVTVYSSIKARNTNHRTAWQVNTLAVNGRVMPVHTYVQTAGRRNVFSYQNGGAIRRLVFRQAEGTTNFVPEFDSSIQLDAMPTAGQPVPFAAGIFVPTAVVETNTVTAVLSPVETTAAYNPGNTYTLPKYYFVGKRPSGKYDLFSISADMGTIENKSPREATRFIGEEPAFIGSYQNSILYAGKNSTHVYESKDNGVSWNYFSSFGGFNKIDWLPDGAPPVRGMRSIKTRGGYEVMPAPEDMKRATVGQDGIFAEVSLNQTVKVFDDITRNVDRSVVYKDHFIIRINNDKSVFGGLHWASMGGMFSSVGHAAQSVNGGRTLIGWDVQGSKVAQAYGHAVIDDNYNPSFTYDHSKFPFAQVWNSEPVMFGADIKYLQWSHWFIMKDESVYTLYLSDDANATNDCRVGLYGSTNTELNTFLPTSSFHLWDYEDAAAGRYVPFVFYMNKRVLLLERIDTSIPGNKWGTGSLPATGGYSHFLLSIPDDNSQPLVEIPMVNANRREYVFFQRNNGLFKLNYSWNPGTQRSSLNLVRIANAGTGELANIVVVSGCETGKTDVTPIGETALPFVPTAGTYLGSSCTGTTQLQYYADGNGNWTTVPVPDSPDCGYVDPLNFGGGSGQAGGG